MTKAAIAAMVIAIASFGWSRPADAVESSVTLRLRHHACDHSLWEHLDRRARAEAETFCSARGGLDEDSMRWVRHDSPYGSDKICVVHLHYGCRGQLPGDLER